MMPAEAPNAHGSEPDFWDRPSSAAEIRERLRDALVDEVLGETATGSDLPRRSPADVLFLVDALVARARREERAAGKAANE